ncbi:c-type cytochrome [Dokdonella sp.]|uniref:c-type cytochrome n=1 Tax=Dokdonella sp. TaxID=2291710 RepID=UPI003C4EAA6C
MNLTFKIKTLARLALLVLAIPAASAFAAPGNLESGKKLAPPCQACHGADGNATAPIYPKLAGQYADYLARSLTEYRDGGRVNPIMAAFVEKLSDQDIQDLAAYYAAMPGQLDDLDGRMKTK